jgi:hypothetical protein
MGIILAAIGAFFALVLVALMVALAKRMGELTRALAALQAELLPVLDAIQSTSEETRKLATALEERARVLRRDDG